MRRISFLISLLLAAQLVAASALPTVAQTTFKRENYTLKLDENGIISSLRMGDSEVLGAPFVYCQKANWQLVRLDQTNPNEPKAILTGPHGDGEIDYRLEPKRVVLTMTHKINSWQTWQMTLSDEVLGIENLQDTRPVGAEVISYLDHNEIRAMPTPALVRTQRDRLHMRNGATIMFWHDNADSKYNVDGIGAFRGYVYSRSEFAKDSPMRIYFALDSPPRDIALQPAPVFEPIASTFANLFDYGTSPLFTLQFTKDTIDRLKQSKKWRLQWTVRDDADLEVTQGENLFNSADALRDALTFARFPVKRHGWFSVVFRITPADKDAREAIPSEYRTRFGVVDPSPMIPQPPPAGAKSSDYAYEAQLGLKCNRESHNLRDFFPTRDRADWKKLDDIFATADTESKHWGINWFFQFSRRPEWCSPADLEQLAFDIVSRYKDRCRIWEVENEPNGEGAPEDYITKALIPFAAGAHRADPTCKILGPDCVNVASTIRFAEALKRTGALDVMAGVSTHTYPGPGEPWELYGNPQLLARLHEIVGDRPLWQTEQGYEWAHTSRREQARFAVRQYLNAEAAGIPNERQYYFYPVHNGFEPWYLVESNPETPLSGTVEPAGIALRVLNTSTEGMSVGKTEHPVFSVSQLRFTGKNYDLVAIWTLDLPLTLTLEGQVQSARDMMGNPIELKRTGTHIALAADGYPIYLRVPRGEALSVVGPTLGTNYAAASLGAHATASSETKAHEAANAIDGFWSVRDAPAGMQGRTYWEAQTKAAPVWLQVDFAAPHVVNQSLLITPLAAVDGCVPRSYDVQISDNGREWRTVATVKDTVTWITLAEFKPVKTSHVRLMVTAVNDGWRLDQKWLFMVREEFTHYTSMQVRILDWMVCGH